MRKSFSLLGCGLALLAGLVLSPKLAPAQQAGAQQVYCGESAIINAVGATSITAIVPALTGQIIAVCGLDANAGAAAATIKLTAGTGTNCNATPMDITPVWSIPINGFINSRTPVAYISTPPGYMLCYTITGTGPLSAIIYYHQF